MISMLARARFRGIKAIDLKAIEAAQVPAIELHNLGLAAALTADPRIVGALVDLLPKIQSEESREDLIVITSIFRDDDLRGKIFTLSVVSGQLSVVG
jgi:hypothetical protein